MKRYFIILLTLILFGCKSDYTDYLALDKYTNGQQIRLNNSLTDVMVSDIFTPPVCSRIYMYPHIAAYETLAASEDSILSLAGALTELTAPPKPPENQEIYYPLARDIAFVTAARPLVFSFDKIDTIEIDYLAGYENLAISDKLKENSIAYGRSVGRHIVKWASSDGYLERTALSEYVLDEEDGRWQPTPPDYMPAIEPHWRTMRTLVIDSASQFRPSPPTPFSTEKDSPFYKEALHIVNTTSTLGTKRTEIAKFWDCNPNVSHTRGHLMFFDQKISPGGHWMSIAGIAADQAELDALQIAKVYALTAITLSDAFISCWDEKYRSSLIRPQTYINKYIEPKWTPLLQTPAFPEHTSGHSVASAAAAVTLTSILGEDFAFHDNTEVKYGLPARDFTSFSQAAEEAAISRLYGGIHYMPAITHGVTQGEAVGNHIIQKLKAYK